MLELAQFEIDSSDLTGALSRARLATEIEPTNPDTHHILGRALLAAGQAKEGAQELERAERLAPQSSGIHFHLAAAYRELGHKEDAQREMDAYVSIKKREGELDRAAVGRDTERSLEPPQ